MARGRPGKRSRSRSHSRSRSRSARVERGPGSAAAAGEGGKREGRSRKKRRKASSSSSSSSSSSDRSGHGRKKRGKRRDRRRRKKKKKKKIKKKSKKKSKEGAREEGAQEEGALPGPALELWQREAAGEPGAALTDEQKSRIQAMRPMTKEEWDARQSVVRRVLDPETGRTRLIKGDGEVLEEIVSKERHKEINKQATRGDGLAFQVRTGLLQ